MFEIIDRNTGVRVGNPYKQLRRASGRADRLSLEYGAYRYFARRVQA